MRRIDSTTNTQQCPSERDSNYSEIVTGFLHTPHAKMFIDDFCNHYSTTLSKHISGRNFFKVNDNENIFKLFWGYGFLEYDLDKLLSNITRNLILFGKAYVEKIYFYDDKGILVGISYKCINCKKIKHRANFIKYNLKTDDNHKIKGQISNKSVIVFNIKDLGFSKKFFVRKIKKLKKLDLPEPKLALAEYFDMDFFKDKSEYSLLKIMKNVFWNGRKTNNAYVSEPYFLYRNMMFRKLRLSFLEYLISQINKDINSIKSETKFSGKIIFDSIAYDYDNLIMEFESGEKNCEQVSNIIFKVL